MHSLVAAALCASVAVSGAALATESISPRIAPSPLLTIDQHRQAVVDGIVTAWRDTLAIRYGATVAIEETRLRESLMGLRSDRLLAASLVSNYAEVERLIAQTKDEVTPTAALKNLGDSTTDLTYTPVNPCRIVDTRNAGGALTPNVSRTFDGYNASSFAAQGGTASNCGMPSGVAAIAMNVYAINPTNLGFIKVWAANATEPSVATINYQVGITAIANGAIVPVDGAHSNRFDVKSPAAVHFVADVVGYFKAPGDTTGLEILANGEPVVRYEYNATSPNLIGGFADNGAFPGVFGATVGGGGTTGTSFTIGITLYNCRNSASPCGNWVVGDYGTVGGGAGNQAGSTLGGTPDNVAFATVGGGFGNTARSAFSAVGGGSSNVASGEASTVAGGSVNTASGAFSMVAGGSGNTASGDGSFAAGSNAQATQAGCFVWADASTSDPIGCFANTFVVRAFGGMAVATGGSNPNYSGARLAAGSGSWSTFSDRNGKENVSAVDADVVLARIVELPVATWNWKSQPETIRHIGPMAQDFYAAFNLGEDDTHISGVDIEGVALAAIQGLHARFVADGADKNREIAQLRDRLSRVEELLRELAELQRQAYAFPSGP